jgi:photosystem II stability/assembly factor-like uncharacterized protein
MEDLMKSLWSLVLFAFLLCSIPKIANAQWVIQSSPTTQRLLSVHFVNATMGYVAGEMGAILKTTDGGSMWQLLPTGVSNAFDAVRFVNSDTGFAFARGSIVFKTTNGGISWLQSSLSGITGFFRSASFPDPHRGYAVGYFVNGANLSSFIAKTTNAGSTWQVQQFDTITSLNGIHFPDANTGYAIGSKNNFGGVILKTTDGGTIWESQISGSAYGLHSVYFTDSNTGYATSENGTIIKTMNGGNNWITQTSGTNRYLTSVYFGDANTGYAVSGFPSEGTIMKTTDAGNTWSSQTTVMDGLNSICLVDANTGYAVGDDGLILKTTNGGVTRIKAKILERTDFRLQQNYPNPFNPTTTIFFSLPSKSFVSLKVFDLIGREQGTIVSEEMSAGNHSRTWNAEGLPSGVYFYRLQAGTSIETKKLILLR